jgi:hypothetical protein
MEAGMVQEYKRNKLVRETRRLVGVMELVARKEADRLGIDRSETFLPQREDI